MRWLLAVPVALALVAALTPSLWRRPLIRLLSEITLAGTKDLPLPSGPFGVGRVTLTVPLGNAGAAHQMPVDIWYPSTLHASPDQRPGAGVVGLGFMQRARAGATSKASPISTHATLPLLVYVPGWNGPRNDSTFAMANLASHGYVVAAIDDVGHRGPAFRKPDGANDEDLGGFDATSEGAFARTLASAERRLEWMVARVAKAIDGLAWADKTGQLAHLAGSIDFERVGILGFSFGGSVAAEIAVRDPRFSVAVNMDGWLFGSAASTPVQKPYLVFNSDFPSIIADAAGAHVARRLNAQLTITDRELQRRQAGRHDSYMLFFSNVDHGDFTDSLFSPSVTDYLKRWNRSWADRRRLGDTIDAYLVSFFDWHLRGVRSRPLAVENPAPSSGVSRLPYTPAQLRAGP